MSNTTARDARIRAARTLIQGFIYTIAAAAVVALLAAFTSSTTWSDFWAQVVGFAFVQSIATAGLAWLMRAHLDKWVDSPAPIDSEGGA